MKTENFKSQKSYLQEAANIIYSLKNYSYRTVGANFLWERN